MARRAARDDGLNGAAPAEQPLDEADKPSYGGPGAVARISTKEATTSVGSRPWGRHRYGVLATVQKPSDPSTPQSPVSMPLSRSGNAFS